MAQSMPNRFALRTPTIGDHDAVADLLNASAVARTGRPAFERNLLCSNWQAPEFDLARDARLAIALD